MSVTLLYASPAQPAGAARTAGGHPSLLSRWHLLSLDAPSIAALWTWFIARCSGVRLPFASLAAMFLAVWILYIADRLLDARALPRGAGVCPAEPDASSDGLEARHRFHGQHRSAFLFAALAAGAGLAWTLCRIPATALRLYAILGSFLAVYLLCIHLLEAGRRLPKELAVGVFFSAAVFIPTVASRPDLRLQLLAPALLFGALCSINCLRIYAWEHAVVARDPAVVRNLDAPSRTTTTTAARHAADLHPLTRAALSYLRPLHVALTALALCLALAWSRHAAIASAIALSSAALFALHRARLHLGRVDLRAAADLVLAAPLPTVLLLRLFH